MTCLPERTVLHFVSGNLTRAELAVVEAHARECASCENLLSAALAATSSRIVPDDVKVAEDTSALFQTLKAGTSVDRYVLLASVGQGAMGEVYAAYDLKLDRRVALKVLRPRSAADDQRAAARLLREAHVIARLSHPNVISVHDVGTLDGGRVFIAMEYVEGMMLSSWLSSRDRPRDEILAIFLDAARGLAAAHADGLVHRDFKPQNVMVGIDGTVRVTDFGLARRFGAPEAEPEDQAENVLAQHPIEVSLTQTGELVGTPLYMAPEQFLRKRVDARTDQFSFCVALYEALYGTHPFLENGHGAGELMAAVVSGRIRPAPPNSTVPLWLRHVLLRGLAVDPAKRWSSMLSLGHALARRPVSRRRRLAAAATAALGSVVIIVALRGAPTPGAMCTAGPARLAGIWEPHGEPADKSRRRHAVRSAMLATGLDYAEEAWSRVEVLLDRYTGKWLDAYAEACLATRGRGEQSEHVLDLRMACLDERLRAVRSLTDVLAVADQPAVASAVDAVNALPSLERCSDVRLLISDVPPPQDEATRLRVEGLRQRGARVKVLHDTGHNEQALGDGRKLIEAARTVGYPPIVAELLTMVGGFQHAGVYQPGAVEMLTEGVWTAIRSKRDDIAAQGAALLSGVVGYLLHRRAEGEQWAELADAVLDRMGGRHDILRAWVLQNRADIRMAAGDLPAALRLTRQAMALKRKALPADHPDIAVSLTAEAEILARMGEYDQALQLDRKVQDMVIRAYGAKSPSIAQAWSNSGECLLALSKPAQALSFFRGALSRWEAALGPDHVVLAYPLTGLGRGLVALQRPNEALEPLKRALRIREAGEPDPAQRAETQFALAQALWAVSDAAGAAKMAQAADREYLSASAGNQARLVEAWLRDHRRPVSRRRT